MKYPKVTEAIKESIRATMRVIETSDMLDKMSPRDALGLEALRLAERAIDGDDVMSQLEFVKAQAKRVIKNER